MLNLFQPYAGLEELAAIERVFASSWLGTGEQVAAFEHGFAALIGRPPNEVQAVSSCTEGLFQAAAALGLGPGDEVVLPSISFLGAAHAIRGTGAKVVLCDVDPVTLNPTPEHVAQVLTRATRAVLVLHYGGAAGWVEDIAELARQRSLMLIEDAAIGLGSTTGRGTPCGTVGDIGVWSFDAMKLLTTGDGGMIRCSDTGMSERIRTAVRLGVSSSGFGRRNDSPRWWEVDPMTTGRRATMNDIAGAMGVVQLSRLVGFLERRRKIAGVYTAALADLPWLVVPTAQPGAARTFFWIQTAPRLRDRLAAHLLAHGVYSSFRYWPLHRTKLYACDRAFPGADQAAAETLLLPLHQGLSDTEVEAVIDAVHAFRGEFGLTSPR
jgi:dTDP-4-amino-4,6-dideoxygalactose transaminase